MSQKDFTSPSEEKENVTYALQSSLSDGFHQISSNLNVHCKSQVDYSTSEKTPRQEK